MNVPGLVWVIANNPNHQATVRRLADFECGCAAGCCTCWFPTWD